MLKAIRQDATAAGFPAVATVFLLATGEFPGFMDVNFQRIILDLIQFDSNPSADADIRRLEVCCGSVFDERSLKTWRRRQPYGEMTVFMVVVRE